VRVFCALLTCLLVSSCSYVSRSEEFRLRAECAARADKIRALPRFAEGGTFDRIATEAVAHYNVSMNRCFVYFDFLDTRPGPSRSEMLVDAYENSVLLACFEKAAHTMSCSSNGVDVKSDEAERRIKDYMKH